MSKARAGKQMHAIADDKVGLLADVSQWLADKGVNIKSSCAYADAGKAHFLFITTDNKKAEEILRVKQLEVTEEEVVMVEMQDKVGALKDMAKKLKAAEIDIKNIYGTASGYPNAPVVIVLLTEDDKKAINVING